MMRDVVLLNVWRASVPLFDGEKAWPMSTKELMAIMLLLMLFVHSRTWGWILASL
jgi:hypothetical protein